MTPNPNSMYNCTAKNGSTPDDVVGARREGVATAAGHTLCGSVAGVERRIVARQTRLHSDEQL